MEKSKTQVKDRKFNFTKKDIEQLRPDKDEKTQYWDTKTRGLYIQVSRTGVKSFYVRRKVHGRSERLFLGRHPELSIEQARTKASLFHASLADGNNLAQARRIELNELTLGELFEEYMERHANKSRKTGSQIQRQFEMGFAQWKNLKLSAITTEDAEFVHREIGASRGQYAANRALELLRALFNKAKEWKHYKGDNPTETVTMYVERSRVRILQADEFKRFFKALDEEEDKDIRDFVKLSLFTGARKTNVLSMRWADIDLKASLWTIPGEQSKNSEAHSIPLTSEETRILKERKGWLAMKGKGQQISPFVFPGKGKTGHLVEPKRAWRGLLKRAEIENLHLHDLRRSMASWMANSGAHVALIQSAMNHKDLKTTLTVYAHTVKDAERNAREKAHKLMLGHKRK